MLASALLFCLIGNVLSTSPPKPKFDWNAVEQVFAFGDSYTFVAGVEGRPNYSFIGDALDFEFTPQELLTNEIIANQTSAGGANWVEFLTGCFDGLPSRCKKQLWNFAFAGANIDPALLPLHHNYTIDLVDQVRQWDSYARRYIPRSRKTLTAWWIGINDTGDTLKNATITDFAEFWELEMTSYFKAVERAYTKGLRGAHLFLNVPPSERSPINLNNPVWGPAAKKHVIHYNTVLDKFVKRFAKTHPDIEVISFDAHAFFNQVLDNPAQYGITNTTGQGSSPGYFWLNAGHPTELVHQHLADAVESQLKR